MDLMRREHSSDYQVLYEKHKFKFPNTLLNFNNYFCYSIFLVKLSGFKL